MKNMVYYWNPEFLTPYIISYGLSFLVLLIGSITDLKTREVPDWLNYGLIISGIALNGIFSLVYSNHSFILSSLTGFSIMFVIAYIMFYTGQWGGGDSKILMGLGSTIGFGYKSGADQFLVGFFLNSLFMGALYGILWSVFLVFRNRRKFAKEWKKNNLSPKMKRLKKVILVFLIVFILIVLGLFKLFDDSPAKQAMFLLSSLALLLIITLYLWIFIRSVEKSSMYKLVEPSKLTEGDWIVSDILLDKKTLIKANLNKLGLDKLKKIKSFINNLDYLKRKTLLDGFIKKRFLFFNYKKKADPEQLRDSDILINDLCYAEYICGPKDLGIEKKQIKRLIALYKQGKVRKVLVKEGIPFVPSFLISFILTFLLGNPLILFL